MILDAIVLLWRHWYNNRHRAGTYERLFFKRHNTFASRNNTCHVIHEILQQSTHWGRVTHIGVGNLSIIASDNGLSPSRRQAIIWTNAGILLTGPLRTNFSEILIEIHSFSFKKMHLKRSSAKWRPFCLGLNGFGDPYALYYKHTTSLCV